MVKTKQLSFGGKLIVVMLNVYLLPVLLFGSRILLKRQKEAARLEKVKMAQ